MNHLTKPKVSISSLILIVSIVTGSIIYAASRMIKGKHNTTLGSYKSTGVQTKPPLRDISDTIGKPYSEKLSARHQQGIKEGRLPLDSLTARQIIAAIGKYYHIPVDYRSKRLAKEDRCFDGTVSLEGKIQNVIYILNHLGIYVKYDGKKIIAGE